MILAGLYLLGVVVLFAVHEPNPVWLFWPLILPFVFSPSDPSFN